MFPIHEATLATAALNPISHTLTDIHSAPLATDVATRKQPLLAWEYNASF